MFDRLRATCCRRRDSDFAWLNLVLAIPSSEFASGRLLSFLSSCSLMALSFSCNLPIFSSSTEIFSFITFWHARRRRVCECRGEPARHGTVLGTRARWMRRCLARAASAGSATAYANAMFLLTAKAGPRRTSSGFLTTLTSFSSFFSSFFSCACTHAPVVLEARKASEAWVCQWLRRQCAGVAAKRRGGLPYAPRQAPRPRWAPSSPPRRSWSLVGLGPWRGPPAEVCRSRVAQMRLPTPLKRVRKSRERTPLLAPLPLASL